jgi:hypothetical protein
MEKPYGMVSSGTNQWEYKVHTSDNNKMAYRRVKTVEEAVRTFTQSEVLGTSFLIDAVNLNPLLRILETMQNTDYIVIPIKKEMLKMLYPSVKESYMYLVVRVPNNNACRIKEITVITRE